MSEELKPCPFCGSTNLDMRSGRDFITCKDCGAEGPFNPGGGHDMAIEEWNSRADDKHQDCDPMIEKPTYGSEEVRKLRETIASMAKIIQAMERAQGCPPFWPVVQVLLDEYGLQLIDIVAAYKQATTDQQRQDCEPIYQWRMDDGSWVDQTRSLYYSRVDAGEDKNRLRILYAAPPKREPLSDEKWLKSWTQHTGQRLKPGSQREWLLSVFRFAERALGIGGQS